MWLFDLFFPQFCKSDMLRYGYLEVFQEFLRDNESRLYFFLCLGKSWLFLPLYFCLYSVRTRLLIYHNFSAFVINLNSIRCLYISLGVWWFWWWFVLCVNLWLLAAGLYSCFVLFVIYLLYHPIPANCICGGAGGILFSRCPSIHPSASYVFF